MQIIGKINKSVPYVILIFFLIYFGLLAPSLFEKSPSFTPEQLCYINIDRLKTLCDIYYSEEGSYPNKANWCDSIKPYFQERYSWTCPNDKIGPCSYAMNENIPDDVNYDDLPDDMVFLFESTPGWNQIGGPDDVVTDRHKKSGANIVFAKGRIEFVKAEDIPNLKWTAK